VLRDGDKRKGGRTDWEGKEWAKRRGTLLNYILSVVHANDYQKYQVCKTCASLAGFIVVANL